MRQPTPVIEGDGLLLRCPHQSDHIEWRALRVKSRKFLTPYEPRWSDAELSARNFAARVRRNRRDAMLGTEYAFFIFTHIGKRLTLVGGLTLSNVRRRAAQNVTLGYWMGADYAGKGIMTRSVALILPFVFDTLALHRIEAACLPDNDASRRVLKANGFKEIGIAEHYLQINGAWRDHMLFALTREHYDALAG
ncbi:GNAT family N-acetyltransferase [Pelagibacterium xiamenense]|uniref:GNAT family N-acetyltransferase n=1 Tax=Pelagibacterium xiamenense TaxID=2901140 RepID=UPI001E619B44|nr:GNAT family protein [Pelagibacterium xiamenense]MCD7059249.1 GNAT family N-acetyltransferase [Pelagibacterium xiamenense]